MNNDRPPALKMEKVLTLNSEFNLCGLKYFHYDHIGNAIGCAHTELSPCIHSTIRNYPYPMVSGKPEV